jgi:RNA ligase
MELRIDRLLAELRANPAEILSAIDQDPLLVKRHSGPLVLANASKALYTPQAQHQLYAKGIVYRRDPYRLVSLPLVKVYNLGERDVAISHLVTLGSEPDVQIRFLRKVDGSLIQVFRTDGRVWFTTRGMLEGAALRADSDDEPEIENFDYLSEARSLANTRYPALFGEDVLPEGRTLLFEFIHPRARKVTNYGDRADLVLLGAFDRARVRYLPYPELAHLGQAHRLTTVDALSPTGADLAAQVSTLLESLAGTDEEGSVVNFETCGEVIYRVKVKSPEYLRLMQLMAFCTYDRTVEIVESNPALTSWAQLAEHLRALGRHEVPEEVLETYRSHYRRYRRYLDDLDRLCGWATAECRAIEGALPVEGAAQRKEFAARVVGRPLAGLLFSAFDGRLDRDRLRRVIRSPREAEESLVLVGLTTGGGGEEGL